MIAGIYVAIGFDHQRLATNRLMYATACGIPQPLPKQIIKLQHKNVSYIFFFPFLKHIHQKTPKTVARNGKIRSVGGSSILTFYYRNKLHKP